MSHAFHDALPGYDPDQILVDRCAECEARCVGDDHGIDSLDPAAFAKAWDRAQEWATHGGGLYSDAEWPMLRVLASVRVQLERQGVHVWVPHERA